MRSGDIGLHGRTALVTGGAAGIGRACAIRLAEAGADVTVLDRDEMGAKATAELVGGQAIAADLSDLDSLDGLSLRADILVNNAGVQHIAPVVDFPPDVFSMILRLMLEAPFRLARLCLPAMYEQGWGRVVNISSVHGRAGLAVQVGLCRGQARAGGPVQGDRAGGRRARASRPTASTRPTCAPRWSSGRSPTRPPSTASPSGMSSGM